MAAMPLDPHGAGGGYDSTANDSLATVILTLLSAILWLSLMAVPIFQAIKLSSACGMLASLGRELWSRPFVYQHIDQNELDSLLLYTSTLNLKARLCAMPIKCSGLFLILILLLSVGLFCGQLNLFGGF